MLLSLPVNLPCIHIHILLTSNYETSCPLPKIQFASLYEELFSVSPSSPVALQHREIPGKPWETAHQIPETPPCFYHQIE